MFCHRGHRALRGKQIVGTFIIADFVGHDLRVCGWKSLWFVAWGVKAGGRAVCTSPVGEESVVAYCPDSLR